MGIASTLGLAQDRFSETFRRSLNNLIVKRSWGVDAAGNVIPKASTPATPIGQSEQVDFVRWGTGRSTSRVSFRG